MKEIRYTLVCDGTTDRALVPILTWLLAQHLPECAIQSRWLDIRQLPMRPENLTAKISVGIELFPCDVLFVHRDAERDSIETRESEINDAVGKLPAGLKLPMVPVIPVRMTEAWLLFSENAIREAAENPNGKQPIENVDRRNPEQIPDPKQELRKRLRSACGSKGRRLDKFDERRAAARVADLIEDFSPLRNLSAFQRLEQQVRRFSETRS